MPQIIATRTDTMAAAVKLYTVVFAWPRDIATVASTNNAKPNAATNPMVSQVTDNDW